MCAGSGGGVKGTEAAAFVLSLEVEAPRPSAPGTPNVSPRPHTALSNRSTRPATAFQPSPTQASKCLNSGGWPASMGLSNRSTRPATVFQQTRPATVFQHSPIPASKSLSVGSWRSEPGRGSISAALKGEQAPGVNALAKSSTPRPGQRT